MTVALTESKISFRLVPKVPASERMSAASQVDWRSSHIRTGSPLQIWIVFASFRLFWARSPSVPSMFSGRPMTMNLRCDDKFAEDEGWHAAAERYENFLRTRDGQKILFLELGVGYNTPVFRSLRTGNKRTKTLRKQRILGHLQILTTNYQERLYA